jgi:hypothetical protein
VFGVFDDMFSRGRVRKISETWYRCSRNFGYDFGRLYQVNLFRSAVRMVGKLARAVVRFRLALIAKPAPIDDPFACRSVENDIGQRIQETKSGGGISCRDSPFLACELTKTKDRRG